MSEAKRILRRALKDGFNLSSLPNYKPDTFKRNLYDYLVSKHYLVCEENEKILVGYSAVEDVAEISIEDTTMKIKPLIEEGFFDIFVELFRYIGMAAKTSSDLTEPDDVSTEDYSEDSSEELWL